MFQNLQEHISTCTIIIFINIFMIIHELHVHVICNIPSLEILLYKLVINCMPKKSNTFPYACICFVRFLVHVGVEEPP